MKLRTLNKNWPGLHRDHPILISTKNKMGYMLVEPDKIMQAFIKFTAKAEGPVVDIGAAYGVATIPVLKNSKQQVIAIDLCQEHLDYLKQKTPKNLRARLITKSGRFPDEIQFERASIGAFLLANVLHYCTGKEIEIIFKHIYQSLQPGKKVFISTISPYMSAFKHLIAEYEKRQEQGIKWPGENTNIKPLEHVSVPAEAIAKNPKFVHLITPDVLANALKQQGFLIERAELCSRPDYPSYSQLDGRETTIVIAQKPK